MFRQNFSEKKNNLTNIVHANYCAFYGPNPAKQNQETPNQSSFQGTTLNSLQRMPEGLRRSQKGITRNTSNPLLHKGRKTKKSLFKIVARTVARLKTNNDAAKASIQQQKQQQQPSSSSKQYHPGRKYYNQKFVSLTRS